jgi:hypothetical protein
MRVDPSSSEGSHEAHGAPASFVAVDRDPLADLESITRVSLRVKEGRELTNNDDRR